MRINWRRQHRWSSLAVMVFLALLCVSGIMLNHREALAGCEVSRAALPPFYRFHDWNGGLMRGTLRLEERAGAGLVAVYGVNGIWLTDSCGERFTDFNAGIPGAAAYRNIRGMVQMQDSTLFALGTEKLYRMEPGSERWREARVPMRVSGGLTDVACRGDSLVILSRNGLYVAVSPWNEFRYMELEGSEDVDSSRTTAFRAVWDMHSGRMFGTPGILAVDAIALVLLFLCLGGLALAMFPSIIRRMKRVENKRSLAKWMKGALKRHRKTGVVTFALTALVCLTGWCLRPPLLIALVKTGVPAGAQANPWHDKLRMVRYDEEGGRWLLSTTEGFFTLDSLEGKPRRIRTQPPVSVMGLNVWSRLEDGAWLCGSFSGMYRWDMEQGLVTDYETGEPADLKPGPPFGKRAVSGYSDDFATGPLVVTYDGGCTGLTQPEELATLPMPLWNVALEVHTGRIYFGNSATYFFIFIVGGLTLWCLLSGLMAARWRKRRKS